MPTKKTKTAPKPAAKVEFNPVWGIEGEGKARAFTLTLGKWTRKAKSTETLWDLALENGMVKTDAEFQTFEDTLVTFTKGLPRKAETVAIATVAKAAPKLVEPVPSEGIPMKDKAVGKPQPPKPGKAKAEEPKAPKFKPLVIPENLDRLCYTFAKYNTDSDGACVIGAMEGGCSQNGVCGDRDKRICARIASLYNADKRLPLDHNEVGKKRADADQKLVYQQAAYQLADEKLKSLA